MEPSNVCKCLSDSVFTRLGVDGRILAPMTCAFALTLTNNYVTCKTWADIIKVSYQLTSKNYPGDLCNHTSPEKQRSFLLVARVKSEVPSIRYIQCACWLKDEGSHRSRKRGLQSYNQKDLALPQMSLQLRTLPS